jgi:hypothetical protein
MSYLPGIIIWAGILVEFLLFRYVKQPADKRHRELLNVLIAHAEETSVWYVARNTELVRKLEIIARSTRG